jgi:hypothetical protein
MEVKIYFVIGLFIIFLVISHIFSVIKEYCMRGIVILKVLYPNTVYILKIDLSFT